MNPIRLTPAVKAVLFACLGFFVLNLVLGWAQIGLMAHLVLATDQVFSGKIWTLVTYALVHSDVLHLVLNLLMLVFIGVELEALWGTRLFSQFLIFCVLSTAVIFVLLCMAFGSPHSLLGLSGGIYGLLCAYGILFSERTLLFMMLFPMKAKHFIWVLAGVELLTLMQGGGQSGIASLSHMSGMASGFVFLMVRARIARTGGSFGAKKRNSNHLKLVVDNPQKKDPKNWQ